MFKDIYCVKEVIIYSHLLLFYSPILTKALKWEKGRVKAITEAGGRFLNRTIRDRKLGEC